MRDCVRARRLGVLSTFCLTLYHPPPVQTVKSEIDLFGFDDRTLWRHKTRNALLELTGNFSGLEHMAPAVDQMASILKRINLLSASEMRREMTQVEALACAGEKTVNELYRRSLSKEAALKGRWEQQRKDAAEHMSGRRRDARNKLEEMSTEVFLTEDFRLTEGRMAGGPCWMKPPSVQEYVTRIDALRRCVVARYVHEQDVLICRLGAPLLPLLRSISDSCAR